MLPFCQRKMIKIITDLASYFQGDSNSKQNKADLVYYQVNIFLIRNLLFFIAKRRNVFIVA